MMTKERINYYAPSNYISGSIIEYDMKSANISILRELGKIDDEKYRHLSSIPKIYREMYIGRWCEEDKSIFELMKNAIKDYRFKLVESNNIQVNEIVRIANDAIYINRINPLINTKFGKYIEFRPKNRYNALMNLGNKYFKVFFKYDSTGVMDIDVKDLGNDTVIETHKNYMLSFIATIMNSIEHGYIIDALNMVSSFYLDYINMRLPLQFYIEMNSDSKYRIKGTGFSMTTIPDISILDISYNLKIIQELWSIILNLYQG